MQLAEFEALRAQIRESDDDLAEELGVPVAKLTRWSTGAERLPRFEARMLRFIAASAVRGRALQESGLPECAWLAKFHETELPDDTDEMLSALSKEEDHHRACPQCQARERFVSERFGPMPPYPTKGWMTLFALFDHVPESLGADASATISPESSASART